MEINFKGKQIKFSPYIFAYVMNNCHVCQQGEIIYCAEDNNEAQELVKLIQSNFIDFNKEVLPQLVTNTIKEIFILHGEETYRTPEGGWRKIPILKEIRDRAFDLHDERPSLYRVKELIDKFFDQKKIDDGFDLVAHRIDNPLGWRVSVTPKTNPNPLINCLVGDHLEGQEGFDDIRRYLWLLSESFGTTIQFIED